MADAARARLEEYCTWLLEYQPTLGDQEVAADIRALLAALAAAEAARDQAREHAADAMMAHGRAVESLCHVEALHKREFAVFEMRDRRLAALEQAARGYVARPPNYQPWDKAEHALRMAVAALAAPPCETA